MATLLNAALHAARTFARDDEGAQVIEYALIIALVSIALAAGLSALTGTSFSDLANRISECLRAGGSCS